MHKQPILMIRTFTVISICFSMLIRIGGFRVHLFYRLQKTYREGLKCSNSFLLAPHARESDHLLRNETILIDSSNAAENSTVFTINSDSNLDSGEKKRRPRVKTQPELRWEVKPIGVVVSPYETKYGVPKQATISARNDTLFSDGRIVLFPGYENCICNLEGFDYIWVISLMHLNNGFKQKIRPQPVAHAASRPPPEVGLFSSRAPHRPNPIALSALRVIRVDRDLGEIHVRGIDLLNDTPVLDIKPYVPAFDAFPDARAGWMDLINPAAEDARLTGYQTIRSPRGERAARYRIKQAQTLTQETPIAEEELAGTESLHGNGGVSEVVAAVEDEDSSIRDRDIHSAPT